MTIPGIAFFFFCLLVWFAFQHPKGFKRIVPLLEKILLFLFGVCFGYLSYKQYLLSSLDGSVIGKETLVFFFGSMTMDWLFVSIAWFLLFIALIGLEFVYLLNDEKNQNI